MDATPRFYIGGRNTCTSPGGIRQLFPIEAETTFKVQASRLAVVTFQIFDVCTNKQNIFD